MLKTTGGMSSEFHTGLFSESYFVLFYRCKVQFENTEMVVMLVASSTDTMSFE